MKNNIPRELYNAAGIYEIRNLVNGKVYVGSTSNFRKRHNGHKNCLIKGKHANAILGLAYLKYGIEAFEFNVICEIDMKPKEDFIERLLKAEEHYIVNLKASRRSRGYNILDTPTNSFGYSLPKGELCHKSKLTAEIVLAMVGDINLGIKRPLIMKKYSISRSHLDSIMQGAFWGHVSGIKLRNKSECPPPNATLNADQVVSIAERIRCGESNNDIAPYFSVTPECIGFIRIGRTWSWLTGFTGKGLGRKLVLDSEKVLKIKFLLENNRSLLSIAREMGIAKYTVCSIKRGLTWSHITGYEPKPFGGIAKPYTTESKKVEIIRLYKAGVKPIELTKKFDLSSPTIFRIIRKYKSLATK